MGHQVLSFIVELINSIIKIVLVQSMSVLLNKITTAATMLSKSNKIFMIF